MGVRKPFPVYLAALLVTTAVAVAACGGGGGSSLPPSPTPQGTPAQTASPEERAYFDALKAALDAMHQRSAELRDFRAQAFTLQLTEEQRRSNSQELGRRYRSYAEEARNALSQIVAPANLEAVHGSLLAAVDGLVKLGQDLESYLSESPVATSQDFADAFGRADGVTVEQRFRDFCFDLQSQARARGLGVDLGCNQ